MSSPAAASTPNPAAAATDAPAGVLDGEPTARAWVVAVAIAVLHATALAWAMAALA